MYVERFGNRIDATRAAIALRGRPGLAWLDGGLEHPAEGRLSYVAADPVEIRSARFDDARAPLLLLRTLDEDPGSRGEVGDGLSGLVGRAPRWMGWIAYDAAFAAATRRPPGRLVRDPRLPVVWLGRYDAVLAWDESAGESFIVADDRAACVRLASKIEAGLTTPAPEARIGDIFVGDPSRHVAAIERALEHIAAGDIYQVNLARRWSASFDGEPLALFLAMREASPVPLGGFVDSGDHAVLARTMERFLRWEGAGGALSTRPIKGTIARRGDDAGEAKTLRADEKEQAEHNMIVDLMRNDLGRVAAVGTVAVEAPRVVEPYAGLAHLVSTVRATTRPDVDLADVLEATFPPGSVTGTPKLRAIEIIEDLEDHPREVYTGCIGMIDRRGGAHFAVAIRTAQIRRSEVVYHAGGGLVAASLAAREVAETDLKARVFLDAAASV